MDARGGASTATALLAGATGLVGRALLVRLLAADRRQRVIVLARKPLPTTSARDPRLTVLVGDMTALAGEAGAIDDVYIALGTTIKVAGSEAAFRAVDLDLVVAIARRAREAGARRLAVVSALGADRRSRVFYNRVKGEMEDSVAALGYESVVLARPSLLLGDRESLGQPTRAGVDPDRLDNFQKMLRENRRDSLTCVERRQQLSAWKSRGREARVRMRAKRGDG